jgi:23S rRNA pseudouridine955/2504/2580 synthase
MPVIYEDEAIIALDKPAGLAVHGGSGIAHGAIESLRSMRPAGALPGARPPARPRYFRRAARGEETRRPGRAARMLRDHADRQALSSRGRGPFPQRAAARAPRAGRSASPGRARSACRFPSEGLAAETIFRRIGYAAEEFSLLEAQLLTGARTRSACTSRTSAIRSSATTSTATSS